MSGPNTRNVKGPTSLKLRGKREKWCTCSVFSARLRWFNLLNSWELSVRWILVSFKFYISLLLQCPGACSHDEEKLNYSTSKTILATENAHWVVKVCDAVSVVSVLLYKERNRKNKLNRSFNENSVPGSQNICLLLPEWQTVTNSFGYNRDQWICSCNLCQW